MMTDRFLLYILCASLVPGAWSHGHGGGDVSIERITPRGSTRESHVKSIVEFWTPERMASAEPMEVVMINGTDRWGQYERQDGPEQWVPGVMPTINESSVLRSSSVPSTVGKVFFVMNGRNYLCSAAVVVAPNRDTVLTAAHCVFDYTLQQWASDWIFVPRYSSGSQPFGKWVWRKMAALNAWTNKQNYNYDVAVVLLDTNYQGRHVQEYTGALGMTRNYNKKAWIHSFGYPVNFANGQAMSTCAASSKSAWSLWSGGFCGVKMPCGMNGGSSGGPWIQQYNTDTRSGLQTSVNSFVYPNEPDVMYGPYFGNDIWNLHEKYEGQ
ncbi:unnamed protein product [Rotaria sp. Silwood2]|nr:unnamed protein product [Rotaria sp. Silwood2]CAF4008749.1 unnamed protein product [Rotaria sp. Silwood2]